MSREPFAHRGKKKSLYLFNLLKKLEALTRRIKNRLSKAFTAGCRILAGKPLTLSLCLHRLGEESEM